MTGGLVRYIAAWLLAGAAVAGLLVWVLHDDEPASLPPVRETQLDAAARVARCELRHPRRAAGLNPRVSGSRRAPALEPGVYDRSGGEEALVAALRRGVIVVHYRPGLPDARVHQLQELQRAAPEGTIVVPNETGMPFEVAVTAWRRLLGCPTFSDSAVDAMQLFHGRFLGQGPDRP